MGRLARYPREFYLLIFCSITIFLASETTLPILPLYVSQKGASLFELGLIIGVPSLCLIVAKLPAGVLCDRVCGDYLLIAAAVGQSLSQFMFAVVPATSWFYPIQVINAIAIAPVVPLSVAITSSLSPAGHRGETMGMFLTSYGLAVMVGPFLCSCLLTFMDYSRVFFTTAFIPILGLIPLIWFGRLNGFRRPQGARLVSPLSSLRGIVRNRNMVILSYLRLSHAVTYAFMAAYFVVYCETGLGIAPALIVFIIGVRGMTDMVLRVPAGKLIDRIDYRWAITGGFAVLAVTYFLIPETEDTAVLMVIMAFYGFGVGLRIVSEYVMLSSNSLPSSRGLAAAYLSMMHNVGAGFGSILAGFLVVTVDIPFIFKVASLLMVSAVFSIFAIKKETREELREIEVPAAC